LRFFLFKLILLVCIPGFAFNFYPPKAFTFIKTNQRHGNSIFNFVSLIRYGPLNFRVIRGLTLYVFPLWDKLFGFGFIMLLATRNSSYNITGLPLIKFDFRSEFLFYFPFINTIFICLIIT